LPQATVVTRVIFLAGLGRSGTTLLERALAQLSGVHGLGEVVHLWRRGIAADEPCGCGAPFSACSFWVEVGRRGFGGWDKVDLGRVDSARARADRLRRIPELALGRGRRDVRAAAAELARHHRRVYAAAAGLTGATAIVDSSKHPSLAYCLAGEPSLDVRVVHVVRDSRGVAYSWTKVVPRPEAPGTWMTRYTPSTSALLWSAHNASVSFLRRLGTPVMLLRYETFLEAPAAALLAVARFAGLDLGPSELEFVSEDRITLRCGHTVAGNPMRFTSGTLGLRRDDEWHRLLSRRDRIAVTALTLPQLWHYGYAARTGIRNP